MSDPQAVAIVDAYLKAIGGKDVLAKIKDRVTKFRNIKHAATGETVANINLLIAEVTRLYGRRPLWITEYGYQTNPPDPAFGVSWTKQARYLTQAFAVARANPLITMMLWFLVRDEPELGGWQSGLITTDGLRKPSFNAYRNLRH